jgi:hypothetical protein
MSIFKKATDQLKQKREEAEARKAEEKARLAKEKARAEAEARQRKEDIETALRQLAELGQTGIQSSIILKKDENLIFRFPNIRLLEPRSVRRGGYSGGSVRIAKGVSIRLGGWGGESHEELRTIDSGSLTITDKRLVFAGGKRTTNIKLDKIIQIEPYSDGIAVRRERKKRTEYFVGIDAATMQISVEDRSFEEPFNGAHLAFLIECLM